MQKASFIIRHALVGDIAAINRIQHECYPEEYHETSEAFINKIQQSPDFCLVATNLQGQVLGYFMCVLASLEQFPCLHTENFECPKKPSLLYLHDMALSTFARGRGVRQAFLRAIFQKAQQLPTLKSAYLVAVQGAEVVWQKEGFKPINAQQLGLAEQLNTYGEGAVLMAKKLAMPV